MKAAGGIFLLLAFLALCIPAVISGKTAVQQKNGTCPKELDGLDCTSNIQAPLCFSDNNCTGDEKCCKYHCKFQCVKPMKDKTGACPEWDASICLYARPAPGVCKTDQQCPGADRCCCFNCKHQCVKPEVKPGFCPVQCGPSSSNQQCKGDEDCPSDQKCCGENCQDPEPENPGFCPNDLRKDDQCPPILCLSVACASLPQ
ncbi:perlwapin-like isoform X1 [Rhinatrema bivittatum]|uniref:perlwapin-like isoform X1 n=1 Tax=Rhinatrema bivittatum TaxID=194408 RepID=UPI00112E8AA3|nr:perlwapin-like isoform X1 [Rhinatrema bivittatum]XP_029452241.1 perlwapin-like isoform X1 [Rhinatrema bivittatum]